MNKIKRFYVSILLVITLLMSKPIVSNANGIVVTPDTFGSDSSLYRIQIGYDVTEIQDGSFSNLVNLQVIDVDQKNPYYCSYDGCLYNKDCTVLLCIPQNTSSVQMLKSVKSRSEHALDGLSENRKNKIDDYIAGKTSTSNQQNNGTSSIGTSSNSGSQVQTESVQQDISDQTQNNTTQYTEEPKTETVNDTQQSIPSADEFQQYVHEEYGKVTFRYTGSGRSVIVVPEGVEKIASFSQGVLTFNDEITTIYLPSTLKVVSCAPIFRDEGDDKYYGVFYQCRNLQNVYGGSYNYNAQGSYIERPYNDIIFWSNDQRYYYDESQYEGLSK